MIKYDALIESIKTYRLLADSELSQLMSTAGSEEVDPQTLIDGLEQKKLLTSFQIERLLSGRPNELVLGDSYVLLDVLGEGGMGQVFKAQHRILDRICAIKVIHPECTASKKAVERFYREMKAVARLSHPNIVMAYDAGEISGLHFFVMEYVKGKDLAKVIRLQGALPIHKAADYIRQAALGLQHAHEAGILHRDIKPSNLLLTDKGELIKILDLGLARLREAAVDDDEEQPLTPTGMIMGTPDFMSPEQTQDTKSVDIRADIYALGCSLYQLLTRQLPFPGGDPVSKLIRHRGEEPQPVQELRKDIPVPLQQVITKMMAKKPDDRYREPEDVVIALQPFCQPGSPPLVIGQPGESSAAKASESDTTSLGESRTQGAVPDSAPPSSGTLALPETMKTIRSTPGSFSPTGEPLASGSATQFLSEHKQSQTEPPDSGSGTHLIVEGAEAKEDASSKTHLLAPEEQPPRSKKGFVVVGLLLLAVVGGAYWAITNGVFTSIKPRNDDFAKRNSILERHDSRGEDPDKKDPGNTNPNDKPPVEKVEFMGEVVKLMLKTAEDIKNIPDTRVEEKLFYAKGREDFSADSRGGKGEGNLEGITKYPPDTSRPLYRKSLYTLGGKFAGGMISGNGTHVALLRAENDGKDKKTLEVLDLMEPKQAVLYNILELRPRQPTKRPNIQGFALSPDGKQLLISLAALPKNETGDVGLKNTVLLLADGEEKRAFYEQEQVLTYVGGLWDPITKHLLFSSDQKYFFATKRAKISQQKLSGITAKETSLREFSISPEGRIFSDFNCSPDNKYLAVVTNSGVSVFPVEGNADRDAFCRFELKEGSPKRVGFISATELVVGDSNGKLYLATLPDKPTKEALAVKEKWQGWFNDLIAQLAVHREKKLFVATQLFGNSIKLGSVESEKPLWTEDLLQGETLQAIGFSKDGRYVLIATDKEVRRKAVAEPEDLSQTKPEPPPVGIFPAPGQPRSRPPEIKMGRAG